MTHVHEISTLYHEVFYDAMKSAVLVSDRHRVLPTLAGAKLTEIFSCFRNNVCKQLEDNTTDWCPSDCYVEEDDRVIGMFELGLDLVPRTHFDVD